MAVALGCGGRKKDSEGCTRRAHSSTLSSRSIGGEERRKFLGSLPQRWEVVRLLLSWRPLRWDGERPLLGILPQRWEKRRKLSKLASTAAAMGPGRRTDFFFFNYKIKLGQGLRVHPQSQTKSSCPLKNDFHTRNFRNGLFLVRRRSMFSCSICSLDLFVPTSPHQN